MTCVEMGVLKKERLKGKDKKHLQRRTRLRLKRELKNSDY
jgi:hypothetical protein